MLWFHRKPRNRRFERQQVLEVKLRSQHVRAVRLRRVARVATGLFGGLAGFFLLWRGGEWALNELVFENPVFAVKAIEVRTDGVIGAEWLRRWSGVKLGENLFALDLDRVRRDLKLVPLIAEAAVERVLPDTLRVRVTERKPVVRVMSPRLDGSAGGVSREIYYLDRAGFVIQPLELIPSRVVPDANEAMTVLTGMNPAELRPGFRSESPQAQAAIELLEAFEESPMVGLVDLVRIDLSGTEVLQVATGQGSEITFGLEQIALQLRRWRSIHDEALKMGRGIASLDLSISNNLPARWLDASEITPVKPKPSKLSRERKKNV